TSQGDQEYPQVSRPVFLDTGGIDGRQARLRREIDRLKACRAHYAALGKEALAASAPADRRQALEWGSWLCCENPTCLWNGARASAASLNIARLGLALLSTFHQIKPSQPSTLISLKIKPALYTRAGATLLLPSQGITPRLLEGKHVCYAGWSCSLALRTSRP